MSALPAEICAAHERPRFVHTETFDASDTIMKIARRSAVPRGGSQLVLEFNELVASKAHILKG